MKNCRLVVIILVLDHEERREGDALKVLEGTLSNKKKYLKFLRENYLGNRRNSKIWNGALA
jgi:hypothetical protein